MEAALHKESYKATRDFWTEQTSPRKPKKKFEEEGEPEEVSPPASKRVKKESTSKSSGTQRTVSGTMPRAPPPKKETAKGPSTQLLRACKTWSGQQPKMKQGKWVGKAPGYRPPAMTPHHALRGETLLRQERQRTRQEREQTQIVEDDEEDDDAECVTVEDTCTFDGKQ